MRRSSGISNRNNKNSNDWLLPLVLVEVGLGLGLMLDVASSWMRPLPVASVWNLEAATEDWHAFVTGWLQLMRMIWTTSQTEVWELRSDSRYFKMTTGEPVTMVLKHVKLMVREVLVPRNGTWKAKEELKEVLMDNEDGVELKVMTVCPVSSFVVYPC